MGNDVNIRYIQTSVGISPKVSFCFRPLNKKSTDAIEFALDFGYHFSFAKKERMQFRYENNSSGNIINDLIIVAFRNISEKKVPVNNYLYSNGNRVDKKIISPDNLFFAFKIGYTF